MLVLPLNQSLDSGGRGDVPVELVGPLLVFEGEEHFGDVLGSVS